MREPCTVNINGAEMTVRQGTTVAAAVLNSGCGTFLRSVSGEGRGPLCGMGVCFECRLTINGQLHARSCQVVCSDGMRIETND